MLIVLGSHPYTRPHYTPPSERQETTAIFLDFERQHPDMVGMTAWSQQQPKTSPVEGEMERGEVPVKVVGLSSKAAVHQVRYGGSSLEADITSPIDTGVRILIYDYPGWQAWVDGRRVPIRRVPPYGLMEVDVPAGRHRLALRFTDTPLLKGAWGISSAAMLLVLLLAWRDPTKRSHVVLPTLDERRKIHDN